MSELFDKRFLPMDEKIEIARQPTDKQTSKIVSYIPVIFFSIAALIAIAIWLFYDPSARLVQDLPGMDRIGSEVKTQTEALVTIGKNFKASGGRASAITGSWPTFRGINRDNIAGSAEKLADKWGPSGPKMIWSMPLGEGHAAASVHKGRIYVLDYDEAEEADALRCLSLDDGSEIWRRWYEVSLKRNHGMSRSIPAVTDNYAVTIGPNCHVMCVRSDSGELLWSMDLREKYGSKIPLWYSGQCPLIENDVAVIAPAGKSLVIGVDCGTGKILWETPNPAGWKMSHSSVMPMTFFGKRMYVYCAEGGMVGVSANKQDAGAILFSTPDLDARIIAPSPVQSGEDSIFAAAGYGYGSVAFKIARNSGRYEANVFAKYKPHEGFSSEVQTPVFYDGHLFGVLPKDAGVLREQFACANPDGTIVWTSGKTARFGIGPFILADDKFYILSDDGTMTMIKASATGFEELGRARLFEGVDSWGPIALVSGRMIIRDSTRMFCFDMR
jgi:outer membrane protein assembly factor BamB